MKTEELIERLAADAVPMQAGLVERGVLRALVAGGAMSVALFAATLGLRPDLSRAWADPLVVAKTGLPLALGLFALSLALGAARPASRAVVAQKLIWAVPAAAFALFVWAFANPPATGRVAAFIGHSISYCLPAILVLSLPVGGFLLSALRSGAPESPVRCGALAGLAAGGLATALYSLFCNEDSPLFFAVWYSGGIGLAALAGAVAGARVLRW